MNEKDIEYIEFLEKIGNWGKEEWVTAYSSHRDEFELSTTYCALISNDNVKKSLENPSWDLSIGDGLPYFSSQFDDGKEICTYRTYADGQVVPLIIRRSFDGMKDGYWEISEEFRHYFNLYDDRPNNKFILIDENGDDEDVILVSEKEMKIKLRLIKEFLAVKNMSLAIFFDLHRSSEKTIEDLGIDEAHDHEKGADFIYSIGVSNQGFSLNDQVRSQGFLMGKKMISGLKDFDPSVFDKKDKTFVDFIIGIDDNGQGVTHTCDEKCLANFFGKNQGEPYFLTPIFFKREVLTKYYSQPGKYSVEDGYLRCGGKWGLRMDNNHSDYVMAFLGDLGHLSHTEQMHWRSFNVTTESRMSYTAWQRGFEVEFTDPERSDLFFKQKLVSFQKGWQSKFGWDLFKPLRKEDEHCFQSLRLPLTNEQKEFDEQVLSLTKLLIDSLNEKELLKGLPKENGAKGLRKLEMFLASKGIESDEMMEFLRNLQTLRSTSAAHRKGSRYEKLKAYFGIDEKDLPIVFDEILIKSIWFLNTLENRLLKEDDDADSVS